MKTPHDRCHLITDNRRPRTVRTVKHHHNISNTFKVVGCRALTVEISAADTRQTQLEMGVKAKVRMGDMNCHGYVIVTYSNIIRLFHGLFLFHQSMGI